MSAGLDERLAAVWRQAAERGDPMPGESSLAADLDSSRPAVREALVRLEERGYVRRRKGADTVVNPSLLDIPARFDRQVDKVELIEATGRRAEVEVLAADASPVTTEESTRFRIAPGTEVFRVRKLWRADGAAVMLAEDCVPIRTGATPDPARSVFHTAREVAGEQPEWEVAWPSADAAAAAEAHELGLPVGAPVLVVDLSGVGRSGAVAYWSHELHVPGALRYAVVRSVGGRP